ncbi:hypothetical protein EXU57_22590 [Segetibacter sp. 3557_3]|uniref:hypothetical protein n=1 Tax=Segetibacter sp. 3557_3 TaxID=2547429 RepID=UPI001058BD9D|nr:hypothetical protein [Segetibacter sp. 3557_3]TDH19698.1 hypothetical protein EXU57_22590 [Segetibacter sp. 3557_3]
MVNKQIILPKSYHWIINKQLVGFKAFSQLEPWFFLLPGDCFWANEKWSNSSQEKLFVFAKRQDNDDLACFKVLENGVVESVYLIHGWTSSGFDIIERFDSLWGWLQLVVKDIEEWIAELD